MNRTHPSLDKLWLGNWPFDTLEEKIHTGRLILIILAYYAKIACVSVSDKPHK